MIAAFIELYTKGDTTNLANKLLHTSSWHQHGFTAYGSNQIEKLWLASLEQFGFLSLNKQQQVQSQHWTALSLSLSENNSTADVTITLLFEHNHTHIKRVFCTVDTISVSRHFGQAVPTFIAKLPKADPLQLSQFDHQLHPQSHHAKPSDLAKLPPQVDTTLNQWWAIWQQKQLGQINTCYANQAKITIAGLVANKSHTALLAFQLKLHNRLNRSYCQLQRVCFDSNNHTAAIQWMIDGDFVDTEHSNEIKRIRLPLLSLITIAGEQIIAEQLQIDWLAICKQFDIDYTNFIKQDVQ